MSLSQRLCGGVGVAVIATSFWAAKNRSETNVKGLGLLERQRVKVWLKHAYQEIDGVEI